MENNNNSHHNSNHNTNCNDCNTSKVGTYLAKAQCEGDYRSRGFVGSLC